jgi:hypothetical protein
VNQKISMQKGKHRHVSHNTITPSRSIGNRKTVLSPVVFDNIQKTDKKGWFTRMKEFGNKLSAKIFKR